MYKKPLNSFDRGEIKGLIYQYYGIYFHKKYIVSLTLDEKVYFH